MRLSLLGVAGLLGLVGANATTTVTTAATVTLEQARELPPGWNFHSDANPSDTITLHVALKEPKMADLKNQLLQQSHLQVRDPSYRGRRLGRTEVNQYRQPDRNVVDAVSGWLRSSGIKGAKTYGSWISFDASVQTVKSLFQANLAYYQYNRDGKPVLRALNYTVPAWLRHDIDFVHPLTHFLPPRSHHTPRSSAPQKPSIKAPSTQIAASDASSSSHDADMPCLTGTYPECIRKLYNITYTAPAPSPVRFGIAGFLDQWIMYDDVSTFMAAYTPELVNLTPPYNYSVQLLNNGANPQESIFAAGIEASLDVEYAMGIAYPADVIYYSTGGRGLKLGVNGTALPETDSDNEPYLEFLQLMLAKPDAELPHVLSISYADDEQSVPHAYAQRVCDMFAALTARGVSVLSATGDGGAVGTGQTQCVSNDGRGRKMFVPTFPASCPWVTSVGATENVGPPLTGALFSAGGFSDYFARPDWQHDVVQPYVDNLVRTNDPRLGLFNHTGRAMPDISAIGSGFQIQYGGSVAEVLGTSASTPVVAGMVALVDDARLRAGKAPLGWLNPLLYANQVRTVLTDVTTGESQGCYFPDGNTSLGWSAVEGYDCVTGLGTVGDFNEFLAALS
ncbi:Tripeptidyl-peptidase sed2 [Diplogelasinospora grovesii]|uniref:tripeptidyl-peptidase II n=1 Tax=Diplogelasinospora grovesii TaxID=303347 RepID=A0AAN6S3I8_9PEZI|nr:Tripeptidyl-peptidase sed2 [Diplogelasinospora grovesii]